MRQCNLCTSNTKSVDYKDTELLSSFLTPQGKISSRKKSHLCAKHQRRLAQAIKRARFLALLSFTKK